MAAFLIGAVFTILPGIALNILGSAFFMDFYFFIAKDSDVNKKEWDTEDRLKIAFYALVAVLEMLCILFNNIVVLSTNFISAFFFGWRAWIQAKFAASRKGLGDKWWIPVSYTHLDVYKRQVPIPGTKSEARLMENMSAAYVELNMEDLEELDAILGAYPVMGERYSTEMLELVDN